MSTIRNDETLPFHVIVGKCSEDGKDDDDDKGEEDKSEKEEDNNDNDDDGIFGKKKRKREKDDGFLIIFFFLKTHIYINILLWLFYSGVFKPSRNVRKGVAGKKENKESGKKGRRKGDDGSSQLGNGEIKTEEGEDNTDRTPGL
jgi:hypothetical protein